MWILLLLLQPVQGLEWFSLSSGRCTTDGRYATLEECHAKYGDDILTTNNTYISTLPTGCYDTPNGYYFISGNPNKSCKSDYICQCVVENTQCSDITSAQEYINSQCCQC